MISIEGWTHYQVEKAAFGRVKTTTMSPEEEERQLAQRKRGQGRLTDQQIAAFAAIWRKWDGLPILESTSVPILELWGDRGHPRPDRPTMRIPERRNIQLQWIRNASHYLLIEEPRQVGKLINEFIPEAGCRKKSSDPSRMLAVPEIKINKESADFKGLPRLPHRSATIYRGVEHESGFNMHPYLTFHSGKFYAMWSSNRIRDLQAGQHVLYSTSENGRDWAEPAMLTPREEEKGMRYFARGFWQREGELIALAAYDEAVRPLFGPGLELRGYIWSDEKETWSGPILVADDTINNFPPKQLSTGEWMMSRRNHSMDKSMLAGGVESPGEWREIPVPEPEDGSQLDEPFWWILPNGSLTAVFRDGSRSRRLYRSFSRDDGQTWTPPIRTDFPDATAKFNVLRLSNGVYAMASNPNPSGKRVPLCLSLSDDGISFNRMFILRDAPTIYRYAGKDPGYAGYHYPQLLEHEGFLYLIHSENMEDIVLLRIRLEDLSGK